MTYGNLTVTSMRWTWELGLGCVPSRRPEAICSWELCHEVIPRLGCVSTCPVSSVRLGPRCTTPHYKLNARTLNLARGGTNGISGTKGWVRCYLNGVQQRQSFELE
nr:MAG: hypothetical protein [Botourmiaviridae sp.]